MAISITIAYPNTDDATFNLDYYLDEHMPMVAHRFGPFGMTGWRVARIIGTPNGDKPAYSVVATLEFGSDAQFRSALEAEGKAVLADVPKFSNKSPTFLVGEIVGQR